MPKRPRSSSTSYTRRVRARKYKGTPYKARYKNAKARFKSGVGLSRRKYLLANRNKLRGTYTPKKLGGAKDFFTPLNEQSNKVVCNYQKRLKKTPLNISFASQQLVMQRRRHYTCTSTAGTQAGLEIGHMNNETYKDVTDTTNTTTDTYVNAEMPNMWTIAANTLLDGGTYNSATAGGGTVTPVNMRRQMLYVKSHKSNFTLTNLSNVAMKLSIYTVRFRQDVIGNTKNPLVAWQTESTLNDNNDSVTNSLIGFGNFRDANNQTSIGARPYTNKAWNKMFGIIQQRHVTLDAGQVFNHTVHIKYNKFMHFDEIYPPTVETTAEINATNQTTTHFKDWTVSTMFVVHGEVGAGKYVLDPTTYYSPVHVGVRLGVYQDESTKFYRVPLRSQSVFLRDESNAAAFYQQTWVAGATEAVQDEDGDIVTPAYADGA